MKPIMYILGAVVIILMAPAVILSITDFRATDYEEPHNVTTNATATTSDITLTQELFDDLTYNATVTSNNTADAPVPSSYATSTRVLTVSGLNADDSRRLTVSYKVSSLSPYWGADLGGRTWPLFLVLGVIGVIAGAIYAATKGS